IDVPVFIAGAWQDEETGPGFANMLGDFDPAVPLKITLMNGGHADSLGPEVISRWAEFLDFYVARRIPPVPPLLRAAAALYFRALYGIGGITLPPDRFTDFTSSSAALVAYEAEPRVRVLFESGAGTPSGAPVPGFETSLASWPPRAAVATTWYFAADG